MRAETNTHGESTLAMQATPRVPLPHAGAPKANREPHSTATYTETGLGVLPYAGVHPEWRSEVAEHRALVHAAQPVPVIQHINAQQRTWGHSGMHNCARPSRGSAHGIDHCARIIFIGAHANKYRAILGRVGVLDRIREAIHHDLTHPQVIRQHLRIAGEFTTR